MMRSLALSGLLGLLALSLGACNGSNDPGKGKGNAPGTPGQPNGKKLYEHKGKMGGSLPHASSSSGPVADMLVVNDCHLAVIDRQDVPCQREGVVKFIGTEIQAGEEVPPADIITIRVGKEDKKFRKLKPSDVVKGDQMLAQLDDRLAAADLEIKEAKVIASKADYEASIKTRDEAFQQWQRMLQLAKSASPEETSTKKLAYERYRQEAISKEAAIAVARSEQKQSEIVNDMHKIKSTCAGVVRVIYKNPGEAIKALEPIVQINNINLLRVEGQLDAQFLRRVHKGMPVTLEPSYTEGPQKTLIGHLQEITCVAVSKKGQIVSGSDDQTMRIWDKTSSRAKAVLSHRPARVRAVACTGLQAKDNLCLSGGSDGKGRLWDLDSKSDKPLRELEGSHKSAITCTAFSPDGTTCATGSEDRDISIWEVETGKLRYTLRGHKGAITCVQFTPTAQLVSASRDGTLIVWALYDNQGTVLNRIDHRSGDVTTLGVSPDGKRALFDQGKSLRILTLPDGITDAEIQNGSRVVNFSSFALFSPDDRFILTAGNTEGQLQLWQTPDNPIHTTEVRQFVPSERIIPTCAAFAPDCSFAVSGNKEKTLLVWKIPTEVAKPVPARISFIEQDLTTNSRQVRIWADLDSPDQKLLPGATVTMVIQAHGAKGAGSPATPKPPEDMKPAVPDALRVPGELPPGIVPDSKPAAKP